MRRRTHDELLKLNPAQAVNVVDEEWADALSRYDSPNDVPDELSDLFIENAESDNGTIGELTLNAVKDKPRMLGWILNRTANSLPLDKIQISDETLKDTRLTNNILNRYSLAKDVPDNIVKQIHKVDPQSLVAHVVENRDELTKNYAQLAYDGETTSPADRTRILIKRTGVKADPEKLKNDWQAISSKDFQGKNSYGQAVHFLLSHEDMPQSEIGKALKAYPATHKYPGYSKPEDDLEGLVDWGNKDEEFSKVRLAAAMNPNLDANNTQIALEHSDPAVVRAALRNENNPHVTSQHLENLLDEGVELDPGVRSSVLLHPKLSPDTISEVLNPKEGWDALSASQVLGNPNLNNQHIDQVLSRKNLNMDELLVVRGRRGAELTPEQLHGLYTDLENHGLYTDLENHGGQRSTSADMDYSRHKIIDSILSKPNVAEHTLSEIVNKNPYSELVAKAIKHPNANGQHAKELLDRSNTVSDPFEKRRYRDLALRHPDMDSDVLEQYAKAGHEAAQEQLALHKPDSSPYYKKVEAKPAVAKLRVLRDKILEKDPTSGQLSPKEMGPGPFSGQWKPVQEKNGNISAKKLQETIDAHPSMKFNVGETTWDGAQRHSTDQQDVFQLNATDDHIKQMKEAGVYRSFMGLTQSSEASGHPSIAGHTIGWIRYNKPVKKTNMNTGKVENANHYHVDEVQTDLGPNTAVALKQYKDKALARGINPDHIDKINNILFGDHHPSEVLMDSFKQHLRNNGHHEAEVHMLDSKTKAPISGMKGDKDLPAHMKFTYTQMPKKIGMQPAKYGDAEPQKNRNFVGQPTWKDTVRKTEKKDIIPGGLADKKTNADFDPDDLAAGIKVEMEHTSDPKIAAEIARDHLTEDKNYYKKLKTIEKAIEDDINKALDDVRPGKMIAPYKYDYSHILTPQQRRSGYKVIVHHSPDDFINAEVHHKGKSVGHGSTKINMFNSQKLKIDDMAISPYHRGKGLGTSMYEAILAHGKRNGIKEVHGDDHSSMAHAVHNKLADKHGLTYNAVPNYLPGSSQHWATEEDWEKQPSGAFDAKWSPYSFKLGKNEHDGIIAMLEQNNPLDRIMALKATSVQPHHILIALQDEDPEVRLYAAKHPGINGQLLFEALRQCTDPMVFQELLGHESADEHHFHFALEHYPEMVEWNEHAGETEPETELALGKTDDHEFILRQLLAQPEDGRETFRKLSDEQYAQIWGKYKNAKVHELPPQVYDNAYYQHRDTDENVKGGFGPKTFEAVKDNPQLAHKVISWIHPDNIDDSIAKEIAKSPELAHAHLNSVSDSMLYSGSHGFKNKQLLRDIAYNHPKEFYDRFKNHGVFQMRYGQELYDSPHSDTEFKTSLLRRNPDIKADPKHLQDAFMEKPSGNLLANPKMPKEVLDMAFNDPKYGLFLNDAIGRNPNVTKEHIDKVLSTENMPYSAKQAAISSHHVDADKLREVLSSQKHEYGVRYSALDNPNITEEHIRLASEDPEELVQERAKEIGHQHYPDSIHSEGVDVKFGTNKLRQLRDLIEEKGGSVHKKDIPNMPKELGKLLDSKGNLTSAKLQQHIDSVPSTKYNVSSSSWKGAQRHSEEPSSVFQLNLTNDHIKQMKDSGVYKTFKKLNEVSEESAHPVTPSTIGWVRFTGNKKGGYQIDEVQSDFGSEIHSVAAAQAQDAGHSPEDAAADMERQYPKAHLDKIKQIVFNGKHPSEVLHEAFHQHLRNRDVHGAPIAVHHVKTKMPLAGQDTDKPAPAHMQVGYKQIPEKMGMKPAKYGALPTQKNPKLQGEEQYQDVVRKKEDDIIDELEELLGDSDET